MSVGSRAINVCAKAKREADFLPVEAMTRVGLGSTRGEGRGIDRDVKGRAQLATARLSESLEGERERGHDESVQMGDSWLLPLFLFSFPRFSS
jgi:hypothetical protein